VVCRMTLGVPRWPARVACSRSLVVRCQRRREGCPAAVAKTLFLGVVGLLRALQSIVRWRRMMSDATLKRLFALLAAHVSTPTGRKGPVPLAPTLADAGSDCSSRVNIIIDLA
jgi:hypothetical protein